MVLITFVFLFLPQLVFSQNKLDSATIRLDSMTTGQSPLDVLVLVTTSSSVTENGIQVTAAPISPTLQNFNGDYFSFQYNDNYELRPHEIQDTSLVDQVTLWGKPGFPNQIIAYRQSSVSDLNEVSAIQMRRQKKDEYTEEAITLDGVPALFFKRTTGIEFVVLAIKDNKLLTIGLSANSNDAEKYLAEIQRTLNSFKWKISSN